MKAAARLVDAYFLPMAERAFGDAAATASERNSAMLAKWITQVRADVVIRCWFSTGRRVARKRTRRGGYAS